MAFRGQRLPCRQSGGSTVTIIYCLILHLVLVLGNNVIILHLVLVLGKNIMVLLLGKGGGQKKIN